jgi:HlyD family secretion protein
MKKVWIQRSAVLVVVLAVLTALYARGREPAETNGATPEFQVAEYRSIEVTAEAAGIIEPIRVVEVKSKASGEILRLPVESGDVVRRGDLLGEVDPRDVRNAYEQAEADLAVAEARAQTASAQIRRSQELRAANVITEQELESATFESANAQAQLVRARANLQLAQERLRDVTIRAPIDGVIIQRNVEEGAIIQSASQNISGGTAIFLMADLTEMQVRTLVDETDLGKIQPGLSARVSVDAYPNRTFIGTITKIEPQAVVEQNVTMFPVLVRLDNRDGALRPGMNGEVVVEVDRRDNVVAVPNAAIVAMRDAMAAGALFGLSEDRMRTLMRSNAGPQQIAMAAGDQPAGGANDAAGAPQAAAQAGQARTGAPAAAEGGQPQRPTPQGPPAMGGQRTGQGAMGGRGNRGGIGNGDVRMGFVFVRGETGVEPRPVVLGINDWEHTEIIRGVEPGEEVVLISVARLQQQQQDMLNRMRERNSGPFPGAGAPGGRR